MLIRLTYSCCLAVAVLVGQSLPAHAHFLFVVPGADGKSAQVVFSEDLQSDENVEIDAIDTATWFVIDAKGQHQPTELQKQDDLRSLAIDGGKMVYGTHDYGVMTRGGAKPFLLKYHPKTVLGNPFRHSAYLGEKTPVEIVAYGEPGDVVFQMLHGKKPVADSELTVILPDGTQQTAKTNAEGKTSAFTQIGRFGVWGRLFEETAGKHGEDEYQQVRHYPTLVIDVGEHRGGHHGRHHGVKPESATAKAAEGQPLSPMPIPASSFGAVACDGWLYVYGGHIADVHTYSTEAVSGKFHRLSLADGKTWEELPAGMPLQGMNLATHGGKIYRVGGMFPKNAKGEETDNWSIDTAAVYDPAKKTWSDLPKLPVPRSSHDLAVVGDKLFVLGGWNMLGKDGGEEWLEEMAVLDLNNIDSGWQSLPQEFVRRALIVAVHNDKIYVVGGFTEHEEPSREVDIFEVASGIWTKGPELPEGRMNGFSSAACVVDGHLYASVADGSLLRLNDAKNQWELVGKYSPRIVHRLTPRGEGLVLVGGAAKMKNIDTVEFVEASLLNGK